MHLYTFVCINAANNWGICVSWRVSVSPWGQGLGNVHFLEFTFVLDITRPTIGEYVSVGGLGNENFLEVTSVLAANN